MMNWKALNHTPVSTTAIYARLQLDPVGEALEANAQRSLGSRQRISVFRGALLTFID
jgi:hypothetical protein